MQQNNILDYIKNVLNNCPKDWLKLTTHRLDIYNESLAKTEFLDRFNHLFNTNNSDKLVLKELPTAYDYIRLGHPLSCILEWTIAKQYGIESENVISFASQTAPILAVLRTNLLEGKKTQILYTKNLPPSFNADVIKTVYGYNFELKQITVEATVLDYEGSTILISDENNNSTPIHNSNIDFYIHTYGTLGSLLVINGSTEHQYISAIQHVRRRETIAMTPVNCLAALERLTQQTAITAHVPYDEGDKASVLTSIQQITGTTSQPLVGSSGLSVQYAIMMGLVHDALEHHKGKAIKFVVPPNCYGGTNDQARRVAACIPNVEVVDLPVDGDNDMVQSIHTVLNQIAYNDAIAYIIAEIPTNPRVEVPNLQKLKEALSVERKTASGTVAVDPVFILDQTFCPNVHFLGAGSILSTMRTISYASGSKFPSGGQCTAGYVVGNTKADGLMRKIELHLNICDNEATALQYEILAKQLPSMNKRIADAYANTRHFVNFIQATLPSAKINFVSEELADQGFTPSVFSLDLPTKGNTAEEKETYKRALNHRLINLMITEIPDESKYCVSYGQLKGCYWTIPATSTQGTTKEGDKDYIARVSLSPEMDLERHKQVFLAFTKSI